MESTFWIAESDDGLTLFLKKGNSVLKQYPDAFFAFLGSHMYDGEGNQLTTEFGSLDFKTVESFS